MTTARLGESDTDGDDERAESIEIGRRLKHLRTVRGLTITELAGSSGVSAGRISQIERGQSNPSINTLQKLRAVLGVTLWAFLEDDGAAATRDSPYVRRRENRPRIISGTNQFTKELLSPTDNDELRFMILTLPPNAESDDVLTGPGDKGGYVLSGKVSLTIGNETLEIREGDSFQFRSTIAHHISNPWQDEAKVLWIINIRDSHV
ncbi:helix-turn-helix domain-containing protein [Paraburkholderia xenovorans]|uniref:helix-turn-helix domain-containing protein n=1 Tax=Paraburkholderia xenovorans TaxID=36873 RepID=UPI0038B90A44